MPEREKIRLFHPVTVDTSLQSVRWYIYRAQMSDLGAKKNKLTDGAPRGATSSENSLPRMRTHPQPIRSVPKRSCLMFHRLSALFVGFVPPPLFDFGSKTRGSQTPGSQKSSEP